jgi:hypothetical protein
MIPGGAMAALPHDPSGAADSAKGDVQFSELQELQAELLWRQYVERRTHARHVETIRTSATNYVLILTTILVAAAAIDKRVSADDLWVGLIITTMGLMLFLTSKAYLDRYDNSMKVALRFLLELDETFFQAQPGHTLMDLSRQADRHLQDTYLHLEKRYLHLQEEPRKPKSSFGLLALSHKVIRGSHGLWSFLPLGVCAVGVLLAYSALTSGRS